MRRPQGVSAASQASRRIIDDDDIIPPPVRRSQGTSAKSQAPRLTLNDDMTQAEREEIRSRNAKRHAADNLPPSSPPLNFPSDSDEEPPVDKDTGDNGFDGDGEEFEDNGDNNGGDNGDEDEAYNEAHEDADETNNKFDGGDGGDESGDEINTANLHRLAQVSARKRRRSVSYDADDELPRKKANDTAQISRDNRPRRSDFGIEHKAIIVLSCDLFKAYLAANCIYPNQKEEGELVTDAWVDACGRLSVSYQLGASVTTLVRCQVSQTCHHTDQPLRLALPPRNPFSQ